MWRGSRGRRHSCRRSERHRSGAEIQEHCIGGRNAAAPSERSTAAGQWRSGRIAHVFQGRVGIRAGSKAAPDVGWDTCGSPAPSTGGLTFVWLTKSRFPFLAWRCWQMFQPEASRPHHAFHESAAHDIYKKCIGDPMRADVFRLNDFSNPSSPALDNRNPFRSPA